VSAEVEFRRTVPDSDIPSAAPCKRPQSASGEKGSEEDRSFFATASLLPARCRRVQEQLITPPALGFPPIVIRAVIEMIALDYRRRFAEAGLANKAVPSGRRMPPCGVA
jgi:hypothetical protein